MASNTASNSAVAAIAVSVATVAFATDVSNIISIIEVQVRGAINLVIKLVDNDRLLDDGLDVASSDGLGNIGSGNRLEES